MKGPTIVGVIALIVAVAIAVCLVIFGNDNSPETRAYERCRADCPTYGAEYVRLGDSGGHDTSLRYECWCRRGTEPLRIW